MPEKFYEIIKEIPPWGKIGGIYTKGKEGGIWIGPAKYTSFGVELLIKEGYLKEKDVIKL